MMKSILSHIHLFQISFFALLSFTILLHTTLFYTTLLSTHLPLSISFTFCLFLALLHRHLNRPYPVFLLNYSCYKPPPHRKLPFATAENFVLKNSANFPTQSIDFMRNIYLRSGLGDETYAPPFIFEDDKNPTLECAFQESHESIFTSIENLLSKTLIDPLRIDTLIVTSGCFSPSPSFTSHIVNKFNLKNDIKTYNLSGMGCSSGVMSLDLASQILSGSRKIQYALVVITESITLNWYSGDSRPMLVTNCIFRVGCAAAIITNDPSCRRDAKMELVESLRTHHGADDMSYHAAFQEEDEKGNPGISLTKDLVRVAGVNLRQHIKILAPRVLPLSQLMRYVVAAVTAKLSRGQSKPAVPDFSTAFEHMCIHTGGKAVIEQVGRVLRLHDSVTEPARMTLHRFGNTSSSLVFYELAYFEAKMRMKKNDRMWMIAFGTGFKVGSLVWKCLGDSKQEIDNPWNNCIHKYPVKV
ncbi:3-ketoacyl-CoA synthase [Heracleum sosnowskyi]|uniref:3-ketoacyl-CoA synthase n=1 Tax=Heracleum sosnowskyi TaxID=360622 RepID=A0AAD8M6Q3_9APIA|nr:3-ketoacyl-CoA synthase [Heracleum sosnowskyi]